MSKGYNVKILEMEAVTREVGRFVVEKPEGFDRRRRRGDFVHRDFPGTRKKEKLDGNRLIFSNETEDDVILAGKFKRLFGEGAIYTVTGEGSATCETGRIDREFLAGEIDSFDQNFCVCGPPSMVDDVVSHLEELGADKDRIVRTDAA